MFHLVVKDPFASYAKGEIITDQAEVARLLDTAHAHHVVKIFAPISASEAPALTPAVEDASGPKFPPAKFPG